MRKLLTTLAVVALTAGTAVAVAPTAAAHPPERTFYAGPDGSGISCVRPHPCSLTAAQQKVRALVAHGQRQDLVVQLSDGTYRLAAPLRFGPADSGRDGHTVSWTAAPGAHPVLSGAVRVTGWTLADPANNVWQAPVPAGLDTRQLYIDGQEAPIAQSTPAAQGVSFAAAPGGYTVSPASWAANLRDPSEVEFVYPGGNGRLRQRRHHRRQQHRSGQLHHQPVELFGASPRRCRHRCGQAGQL